jgi:hypothetical protein
VNKTPLISVATLLASVLLATSSQLAAATEQPPAAKVKTGTTLLNADLARVAKTWERLFGGTVTLSDRARTRKVSIDISAPSKDELRKMFAAVLREQGIQVVERAEGVLFDIEPAAK